MCFVTVSFAMPVAVLLSQCTGVGGCGCPISCKIKRNILVSLPLINKALNLASAADAATNFSIPHTTNIFPFNKVGFQSCGTSPMKYTPTALLLAPGSDKEDASE